jgi:protein ImuB
MIAHPQQTLDLLREVPARQLSSPAVPASTPVAAQLWAAVHAVPARSAQQEVDEDAWPRLLTSLLPRAHAFTPRVVVEAPDTVLLEIAGSQRLFDGMPGLLAALRAAFPRPMQLALAPTPLAAVLLARAGRNCCITSTARLQGRLAPLALKHLRWPEEELQRLRSMGVHTLAELLRLPRAGLARRIGPARLLQLDQLTGLVADPRASIPITERFIERIDPDYETVDRERLVLALQPALGRLEDFLRERQRGLMALRVLLHYRRAAAQSCVLHCVAPEYRAARFTALLTARLEAMQLPEPVRRMELTAGRLQPFVGTSQQIWAPGEHGGSAAATVAPEFLQTLMARLGERAVYGLAEVAEHRPERRWRDVSPGAALQGAATASAAFVSQPLGLMAAPQPLDAICDAAGRTQKLLYEGRDLQLVSGPERIESGWWDGNDVTRDYYVARATDGAQWWVFRECGAPRRWFVHGCFA